MGHEQQDIDEEAQEADEEIDDAYDEQQQQVPRRVGRAVQVGDEGEDKHDEGYKSGNRVNDEES